MKQRSLETLALAIAASLAVSTATALAAAPLGPAVKPGAVAKKAGAPAPANASKTKSAGKGAVKASTANSPTDDDSTWVEAIDVDGDGNVEDSNLVWDDEDGILLASTEGAFTCKNGATGDGGILIGINAKGNQRGRPAGSGFWVAAVDAGECGVAAAGLWGCRFDANGVETSCGMATLDEKNDELVIVAAN
jgi:hypothetical protein